MDYSKLKKKELIELCKENDLHFSSNMTKLELEKILIKHKNDKLNNEFFNEDLKPINVKNNASPPHGIGKAGAILNIIFSIIGLSWIIILLILIPQIKERHSEEIVNLWAQTSRVVSSLTLFFLILSLGFNIAYLKNGTNKIAAGIFGLIFCLILGGILVLVSN